MNFFSKLEDEPLKILVKKAIEECERRAEELKQATRKAQDKMQQKQAPHAHEPFEDIMRHLGLALPTVQFEREDIMRHLFRLSQ